MVIIYEYKRPALDQYPGRWSPGVDELTWRIPWALPTVPGDSMRSPLPFVPSDLHLEARWEPPGAVTAEGRSRQEAAQVSTKAD